MEPLNFVQDGLMNSAVRGIAVGNGQSRLGDNAGNDVFRAIPIQGVQGGAPAYQFAARELSFHPLGVFPVLIMEALKKELALFYQATDRFCVLKS